MHLHVITRVTLLVVCMYMCIAAVSSVPIDLTDYLTRGTVYFPTRDRRDAEDGSDDYDTRGTVWFPSRKRRSSPFPGFGDYFTRGTVYLPSRDRRNYVPVEPGMMDHMCVIKPSFYCMCTANGYVSFCENHTSSYFTGK